MIDAYILNSKEINKLHKKLAKQATKLSTPSYVMYSLLCGILPDWSDIKLKLPPMLGEVPESSPYFDLDTNAEFEKIKEEYGLTEDDFIMDTRGEPGNSKSYTEVAQPLPDLKYLLHHLHKLLTDSTHRASPKINSTMHKSKPGPLHCIANQNQRLYPKYSVLMMALFLKYGALANAVDSCNMTPLYYAVEKRNYALAKMLIKAGGDVNWTDKFNSSIFYCAVYSSDVKMLEILRKNGAQLWSVNGIGRSPLIKAAYLGKYWVV